ncbi:MAG TPA: SMC-Scp complex subunit ScpB [Gammaproteobacteria bacterium]|nr:SMC-Scp complex subunit ScpB [Gammaproteobacteria bacterium]
MADASAGAPALEDIILAALFAADRSLPLDEIGSLFELGDEVPQPSRQELQAALERAEERLEGLPLQIRKLASGYRLEVPGRYSSWVSRLWVERPARYSRALLETLALIAYRQPITRPEIESVRGVAVSTNIIRTLTERGWVRIVGHRDVPGRPALYGTTRVFLDYFGLASLEELPTLAEIRELSEFEPELPLGEDDEVAAAILDEGESADAEAAEEGQIVAGPWEADKSEESDVDENAPDGQGSAFIADEATENTIEADHEDNPDEERDA